MMISDHAFDRESLSSDCGVALACNLCRHLLYCVFPLVCYLLMNFRYFDSLFVPVGRSFLLS